MGRDAREIPLAIESLRAVARHEPAHRPRDRLPPGRHRLSVRDRGRASTARPGSPRREQYQVGSRRLVRGAAMDDMLPGAGAALSLAACTRRPTAAPNPRTRRRRSPRRRARAGATVLTDCAVRGIETTGRPRVRRGHRDRAASPATRSCSPAAPGRGCSAATTGIDLPQLKVLASVFRTPPLDGGPEIVRQRLGVRIPQAARRRLHDRRRNANIADITPDRFRLPATFLPTLRRTMARSALRLGRRFLPRSWQAQRRWSLDEATPVRGGARARSAAARRRRWKRRAARSWRRIPGVRRHADRAELGRHDRRTRPTRCR